MQLLSKGYLPRNVTMPPKRLKHNMKGDFEGLEPAKSKRVVVKIEMSDYMQQYIVDRDRALWVEGLSREDLKNKYNII